MSKELVISANRHETRVAMIEDDQVVEVYHQRENEYSLAGSIHKGRVTASCRACSRRLSTSAWIATPSCTSPISSKTTTSTTRSSPAWRRRSSSWTAPGSPRTRQRRSQRRRPASPQLPHLPPQSRLRRLSRNSVATIAIAAAGAARAAAAGSGEVAGCPTPSSTPLAITPRRPPRRPNRERWNRPNRLHPPEKTCWFYPANHWPSTPDRLGWSKILNRLPPKNPPARSTSSNPKYRLRPQ
jgi:hypothetical protein